MPGLSGQALNAMRKVLVDFPEFQYNQEMRILFEGTEALRP
jgi:hypothetical protein